MSLIDLSDKLSEQLQEIHKLTIEYDKLIVEYRETAQHIERENAKLLAALEDAYKLNQARDYGGSGDVLKTAICEAKEA